MPNELSFHGTTGATYYAVARQGANAYEENSEQYVPELLASRNGYALPMTETPAGGGRFLGDAPASLPVGEVHEVAVYRQAGASPDGEADGEAVGVAMLFWDGLVFAPAADGARISLLDRLRTRGPTIYVSPDGDDAYAGTLRGRAKATLAAGLAALADGGTLVVARGYYSEAGLELANSGCRVLFEPGVALSESLGGTPGLVVSGDDNMIEGHWYVSLGDTAETAVRISGDRNWLTGSLGINTCGVGLDLTGSANRVESVSVREPRTAGVRVTGEENRVGRAAVNPGSGGYPNAKSVLLAAGAARNVIARCSGGQAFAAETGADDNDIIDCAGPGYTDAGEGNLWPGWHEAPALASADIPTAADNATAAAAEILLTPEHKIGTTGDNKVLSDVELSPEQLAAIGGAVEVDAPSATEIRQELDANSTRLAAIHTNTSRYPANLNPNASLRAGQSRQDIASQAFRDDTLALVARVYDHAGTLVTQAAIESIAYSAYLLDDNDADARMAITGHADVPLDAADVIFDTLQNDALWTADSTGYNFRHTPDNSENEIFAVAGRRYLVEYTITPVTGPPFKVRFRVNVI